MENELIGEFNCDDDDMNCLNVKSSKHICNYTLGYKKSNYGFI